MPLDFTSIEEVSPQRRGTSCHIQWSACFQNLEEAKNVCQYLEAEGFNARLGISPEDFTAILFIDKELLADKEAIECTHEKLHTLLNQNLGVLDNGWIGHFSDEDEA